MRLIKAVVDTNVVVSAFFSKLGASYAVLTAAAEGAFAMVATPPLFLEYEEVLKRPETLLRSGLPLARVEKALDGLAAIVVPVDVHFLWRPQLKDPDDEIVLEAAINGQARYIVTFNVRDFPAAKRFGVAVVTPQKFLEKIKR